MGKGGGCAGKEGVENCPLNPCPTCTCAVFREDDLIDGVGSVEEVRIGYVNAGPCSHGEGVRVEVEYGTRLVGWFEAGTQPWSEGGEGS